MEEEKETGLKSKVALVTGANHGIGAAMAQALAGEGAAVFITYLRLHQQNATGSRAGAGEEESIPGEALYHTRQAMSAEQVVQAIRERGGRAVAWEADLANPLTISELFDRVEDTLGPVDVLVNNAAHCVALWRSSGRSDEGMLLSSTLSTHPGLCKMSCDQVPTASRCELIARTEGARPIGRGVWRQMRMVSYIPNTPDMALWDDLVDRLKVLDVGYLSGGSAWDGRPSRCTGPQDVQIPDLIADLAHAPHPRLRDALVALLFRHPEYAPTAREVAAGMPREDRAWLIVLASILAAAALRRAWKFTLDIYLPGQPSIDAEGITDELGVPSPADDYGRACLRALSALLARDQPFPFDYARAWEDVAEHILDGLRTQAG